jgi:probable rRNA maturation factor
MARPVLTLSLQFARDPLAREHRAILTRSHVMRCLRAALERDAELTVRIVDEAEGLELNRAYRQQDHATNVLTFDYSHDPVVVADLVLCAPVVEREAREQGIALSDHYAHLLVHGALHAHGYDHMDAGEAELMEARESAILAGLGIADPYAAREGAQRALLR